MVGFGSEFIVYFRADPPRNYTEASDQDFERAKAYRAALVEAGILEPVGSLIDRRLCLALTDEDLDATIAATAQALGVSR